MNTVDPISKRRLDNSGEAINTDESETRLKQVEKIIASLENKRNKLTDMLLDDKISKDA